MKYCKICKKVQNSSTSCFKVCNEERRIKWSKICGMDFRRHEVICMDHFTPSHIITAGGKSFLLPTAVPILPENNAAALYPAPFDPMIVCREETKSIKTDSMETETVAIENNWNITRKPLYEEKQTQTDPITLEYTLDRKPLYEDKQTQTDPITLEYTLDRENFSRKVRLLENKIKDLESEIDKANAVLGRIRSIFTEGQIKKLMYPSFIHWKWPDISSAICLHASGSRAYNHLYRKGYPLPHESTLQRWCRKIDLSEGILTTAVDFMTQIPDLEPEDKICVLAFDEMKVMETFEYDAITDSVRTPANFVQVVMARGLRRSWKQPVFFNYDCQMTPKLLQLIIGELSKVGFPVVSIVCDMGPTNRKLFKELGVSPDRPWFPHPTKPTDKVFTFADIPHLLKLIRNHFLDTGLIVKNELLTSKTFADLLKYTSTTDVSISFKISDEHLSVRGAGRQKVKLASQLFSNTTANAIRRCVSVGLDLYKPLITADLVQLVNDWFDIHNSSLGTFTYPGKEPFGIVLEKQCKILNEMNSLMSASLIPNQKRKQHFQSGILLSNNALIMLHKYVGERYKMEYICTNRLNQDILEHFFGAIRSKGGLNDHPTPKEFKYRIRKYILARNTEQLSGRGNVEADNTEWLNAPNCNDSYAEVGTKINNSKEILPDDDDNDYNTLEDLDISKFQDVTDLQEDALEYISGYIIRKLNLEEYISRESSYTWVDQVSKGFLKKPSPAFVKLISNLEAIFRQQNGQKISHCPNLHKRLVEASKVVPLAENIRSLFFKCRIHFRIRNLNKNLRNKKATQRMLIRKKIPKLSL